MKRVVVVSGATGLQGGSVVRALLSCRSQGQGGEWEIRALTRNANSQKARDLKEFGVEVLEVNLFDKSALLAALDGAYAFFAVTNFWDPETMEREVELGKQLVDCAKEVKIKHFIWSTLPNMDRLSNGKWIVPHSTNKAIVEEYCRKTDLFATYVSLGFYFQNFATWFAPQIDKDNETLVFTLPMPEDKFLNAVDVTDVGPAVVTALNDPQKWKDKVIPLLGENCTLYPQDYVRIFSQVTGKKARYNPVSLEEYAKILGPLGHEMSQMFGYFIDYDRSFFSPDVDLSLTHKAVPHLKTFRQWLKESGWTGPDIKKGQDSETTVKPETPFFFEA